jgi:hypothetical protein
VCSAKAGFEYVSPRFVVNFYDSPRRRRISTMTSFSDVSSVIVGRHFVARRSFS